MSEQLPAISADDLGDVWAVMIPLNEHQELGVVDDGDGTCELFVHTDNDPENEVRVLGRINATPQNVMRILNVISAALQGDPECQVSTGAEAHAEYLAQKVSPAE